MMNNMKAKVKKKHKNMQQIKTQQDLNNTTETTTIQEPAQSRTPTRTITAKKKGKVINNVKNFLG